MAATLDENAALVDWPPFQRRVKSAMVTAAVQIGAENTDSPPTEAQRLRHALSANVLLDPNKWARNFAEAVAQNPVITYTSSDNDIQFTTNSVWNAVAGVLPMA